jgi:hypothetical protein
LECEFYDSKDDRMSEFRKFDLYDDDDDDDDGDDGGSADDFTYLFK